jgi:transcriptional regulator with GAF, ATPase, and Fis domain
MEGCLVAKTEQDTEDKEEKENKLVGVSQHIRDIHDRIAKAAKSDLTVLIEGPTGTGKELIAKNIHLESERKEKPMLVVNCSSIPGELFESELFGHMKGAFTGAINNRVGKIELAEGGTLFLDEIGDMTPEHQPKILRFLEDGIFTPVGGTQRKANVRIIAATNKDLNTEVQSKNFRQDLYYRLTQYRIRTTPLAERREDIVSLINKFYTGRSLTQEEAEKRYLLYACSCPGNVRQLLALCGSELKDVKEEMLKCIFSLNNNLRDQSEKGRFEDLPMQRGAIDFEEVHGSRELAESISKNRGKQGQFRELSFLLRILGSLTNHPDPVRSVRAYEVIVLAQETSLNQEQIAETARIRKKTLTGKNFKSYFGFDYPKNKKTYYVLHPYDAYPEPYELHGSDKPGPDFYNRYGFQLS